jgi:predicted oxidoreductase
VTGQFELGAQAVVVTAGGIGGNYELVRSMWPARLGPPPTYLLSGVPDHVDGSMLMATQAAGGRMINGDRLWAYPEGIHNHSPVWSRHGIRILSGPSPLWLDARGERLPAPIYPGFDSLAALAHITRAGDTYSWFVLNQRILGREFALSGSEQNPDLTNKDVRLLLQRVRPGAVAPVEEFARRCADFVFGADVPELARGMNALAGAELVDPTNLLRVIVERDRQITAGLGKDLQLIAIAAARRFLTDRIIRVARPHRILDPAAGPLVAVRLSVLTRKTLGGLETDLASRVLTAAGAPMPGLYAAGEAAGFGGGGMHGYRSLEGTFLGGCLYSGRVAGRAAAAATA